MKQSTFLPVSRKVGRATPCAPRFKPNDQDGAHGVTRPTTALGSAKISRRGFCARLALAGAAAACQPLVLEAAASSFRFRYLIGSSMYGELPLSAILPEIHKAGAEFIDIWPRKHGNQREQMDEMGLDKFEAMLKQHKVRLGVLTRYDLGPFKLQPEMKVAQRFGASVIVTGASGPKDLKGPELKAAVRTFAEQMKPHIAAAEAAGVTIGIENHGNSLADSPDSLRWLMELAPAKNIGIALAPYHLEGLGLKAADLARLIEDLGNRMAVFYAWQHGMGCMTKLPKEQELLQMPGRGELDFTPLVRALKKINYHGFTEIFMHPVPRGIPILDTAPQVTAEINRARDYLEACLKKT